MKLSKKAIDKLDSQSRMRLALALGFTAYWIDKALKKNKPNSSLTTATALRVIKEETGLTDDQILVSTDNKSTVVNK